MPDLSFDLEPKEALAFWKDKIKLSPGEFDTLTREAKIRAFSVSGIARGDELNTVFNSLQSAIEKGVPFEQFKADCGAIFERRGWTGARAWRVDNIFRTNIQTAYSIGNYQQMSKVKESRPYWRYSAVNDRRTRPAHRAMHGKVFPADYEFWNTWYPPNGFRCRCSVNSVSAEDLDSYDWKVETKNPTGRLYEPTDADSGVTLPARALMPDPGWDFNPAKSVLGGLDRIATKPGMFKDMAGLKVATDYKRRSLDNVRPAAIPDITATPLARGLTDEQYQAEFKKLYGDGAVLTDPAGEPVILSLRSFQILKEPGSPLAWKFTKAGHGESIPLLREMIEKPFEIWLTPQISEDGRIRLTKRYVSLWKDDSSRIGGLAIFEVVDGQFVGVTSFLPMAKKGANLAYLENQRQGLLLYKK